MSKRRRGKGEVKTCRYCKLTYTHYSEDIHMCIDGGAAMRLDFLARRKRPEQTAWLIELHNGPVVYWAAPGWTEDPQKAVWFARESDARGVAQYHGLALVTFQQHIWMGEV